MGKENDVNNKENTVSTDSEARSAGRKLKEFHLQNDNQPD